MAAQDCQRRIPDHSRQGQLRTDRHNVLHSAPIGVFDSGVGGLSVLRALQQALPLERFVYVADSGNAPYGDRDDTHALLRSQAIASYLTQAHEIKILVVACNTATAAAIHTLRQSYPALPLVGIEPALKPALAHTQTGLVAVLATRATLNSEKFQHLQSHLGGSARLVLQPCDGLASAIERNDQTAVAQLCRTYLGSLGPLGTQAGQIDSLVLGCTHYPFVTEQLAALAGPQVQMYECGEPVARQTRRLLEHAGLLAATAPADPALLFHTSGSAAQLESAVARWLGLAVQASPLPA